MTITTVACRTCYSGWYGSPNDVCPKKGTVYCPKKGTVYIRNDKRVVCTGQVVVTDTFRSVDVR